MQQLLLVVFYNVELNNEKHTQNNHHSSPVEPLLDHCSGKLSKDFDSVYSDNIVDLVYAMNFNVISVVSCLQMIWSVVILLAVALSVGEYHLIFPPAVYER